MGKKLETAVNVVTLVTCVAVLGTLGAQAWVNYRRVPPPSTQVFRVGDTLPRFEGLKLKSPHTLVMVLRKDCEYCAQSLPFYRALEQQAQQAQQDLRPLLAILTPDDPDTARKYVERNELHVDAVVSVPAAARQQLRVPGTPTLMLVDRESRIERVWIGFLDSAREDEVRTALFGANVGRTSTD